MFYKTLDPGAIGHKEAAFLETWPYVKKYGFDGYWFDARKDFKGDPNQVKKILEENAILPAGFGLPVEFREEEAKYQKDLKELEGYAVFAERIGITRCITWILPASDTMTYEENFAFHVERLRPAAEVLKKHGISLGLEFLGPETLRKGKKFEFIHSLEGMLSLAEAIRTGNVGILLDVWHWDLAGQKFSDFKQFSSENQIVCAHVMDAPVNIPASMQEDLIRRLPGSTGVLRIEEFFEGLLLLDYEGPVLAEPFEAFLEELPLESAIRVVKRSLDRVWPV